MNNLIKIILVISLGVVQLSLISCSESKQSQDIGTEVSVELLQSQARAAKSSDPIETSGEVLPIQTFPSNSEEFVKLETSSEVLPIQTYPLKSEETVKSETSSENLMRYEIKHEADGKTYWMSIIQDGIGRSRLTLFDEKSEELQSFYLLMSKATDIELKDLNSDGYIDILFGLNDLDSIQKEYDEAYLWEKSSQTYTLIEFMDFYELADFEIEQGYIKNYLKSYPNYFSILQTLVFDGNTLSKVEEYYEIQHKKDDNKYWVSITQGDHDDLMLTLFNSGFEAIQATLVDDLKSDFPDIDIEDLNSDGYMDVIISLGGTWNEDHIAYLWDISSQGYIKVIFEGFEMLAEFEVREGYIENFIRGDSPEDSDKEKLVFYGNVLKKIDNY